jgi:hypothetical protein
MGWANIHSNMDLVDPLQSEPSLRKLSDQWEKALGTLSGITSSGTGSTSQEKPTRIGDYSKMKNEEKLKSYQTTLKP